MLREEDMKRRYEKKIWEDKSNKTFFVDLCSSNLHQQRFVPSRPNTNTQTWVGETEGHKKVSQHVWVLRTRAETASLQWWYHGVIMVLSWCYCGVIMVLSWCYHGVTMLLSWCYHGVSMVLPWCYYCVTMLLLWCYYVVAMLFPWCYHGVIMVLSWCYHGVIML